MIVFHVFFFGHSSSDLEKMVKIVFSVQNTHLVFLVFFLNWPSGVSAEMTVAI